MIECRKGPERGWGATTSKCHPGHGPPGQWSQTASCSAEEDGASPHGEKRLRRGQLSSVLPCATLRGSSCPWKNVTEPLPWKQAIHRFEGPGRTMETTPVSSQVFPQKSFSPPSASSLTPYPTGPGLTCELCGSNSI